MSRALKVLPGQEEQQAGIVPELVEDSLMNRWKQWSILAASALFPLVMAGPVKAAVITVSEIDGIFSVPAHASPTTTFTLMLGTVTKTDPLQPVMIGDPLNDIVVNLVGKNSASLSSPFSETPAVVIHGPGETGTSASFNVTDLAALSVTDSLSGTMTANVTLFSNTLVDVDLTPFEAGGTFVLSYSGIDIMDPPGQNVAIVLPGATVKFTLTAIPEPGALSLLLIGSAGLGIWYARRRRRAT